MILSKTMDGRDGPALPEHPELRSVAEAIEAAGISAEICDARFRLVFISSEEARSRDWWKLNVPIMRVFVDPDDDAFEPVFGDLTSAAARVEPLNYAPRAWWSTHRFPDLEGLRTRWLGDVTFVDIRLNDDTGEFIGVLRLSTGDVGDSLLLRLGRGDRAMHERMDAVADPARRSAAVLFADLESSGEISRRVSSRAYFDLVRGLTDLIDRNVVTSGGIVGKHAGDGASALFVTEHFCHSESEAARAAIEAARRIHERAGDLAELDERPRINVGLHRGATLVIGQVATTGRLEVTALGDEMNEAARIQDVACGGKVLASKHLIERLEPADAAELGLELDEISYATVASLHDASDKALRDAGTIPVAAI